MAPLSLAQFLNKPLDELIEKNVDICAFYKTCLMYINAEMVARNEQTFDYEVPVELPNGSFKMRINYGQRRD